MDIFYIQENHIIEEALQKPYFNQKAPISTQDNNLILAGGFFIVLVINGTSCFTDKSGNHLIEKNDLLLLTPSMSLKFCDSSEESLMVCIYIAPDYFDSLADGQPLYHQLSKFTNQHHLPVFHLSPDNFEYLQKSISLFSNHLTSFRFYKEGIIRHLYSFLLLQITDILSQTDINFPLYIKRSYELFRKFKKLLVDNYKTQHNIIFYSDKLNISTTYLSRIVKKMTGHTVRFHISQLICIEAKRLLKNTDLDIKEIADILGFSDQSVFGKFFAKEVGFSPLKYRLKKGEN